MKSIIIICFLFFPGLCFAQFLGLGFQTGSGDNSQFAANITIPYGGISRQLNHKLLTNNSIGFILGGGLDYTTSGAIVSGLNIKPFSLYLVPKSLSSTSLTFSLRFDAGYNINLTTHGNSGIVVAPNFYADYKIFFLTAGYDYNTFHNEGQFNVRVGFGIPIGFIKAFNH
jgi:hypothetical protein